MHLSPPVFPPLFTGFEIAPQAMPFAEACRGAASGQFGAADIAWSGRSDRAEIAIVLEPDVPRLRCLQMMALAMVAAGDCLGALMPPQMPVTYRWPDRVLINAGEVGRIEMAMAAAGDERSVPDWLVVALGVQLSFAQSGREPGEVAHLTAIAEEGGGDIDRTQLLQSFSSHFLTWLHTWQTEGFRPVAEAFMPRLERREGKVVVGKGSRRATGAPLGLDEEGGLVLKPDKGPARTLRLERFMSLAAPEPAPQ